ncbi:nuclear transport factor 2 family protein [Streptacidiphilus rugosus]|uniref:nuclear transport factor 2 family protein n=1 Tax=Streptacidiphilus rugosus TaxID=405783 RepID=UPI00068ABA8C|nr:nuclear transport factor 2 family protein [Streptacidiphilus rugosus]
MPRIAARAPQEVFESHVRALLAEDLDAIVANFAEDAVSVTRTSVRHGHRGIRQAFIRLFLDLPHAKWHLKTTTFAKDVLFLEWSAQSEVSRAHRGVNTLVFGEGLIRAQTIRYTLLPAPAPGSPPIRSWPS